jgi:hypothetical protein
VFGLAEQVRGDQARVGGVVGEDRDLGRPGFGVDTDHTAQQPLGRRHVDVARTGDQVDRVTTRLAARARREPAGEQRDRLGTADGPDLLDLEQGARGEDRRVGESAVRALRRGGHGEGSDAGRPGRDDVHHHRRRVDGETAGHVETDPADRDEAGRHGAAGDDRRRDRRGQLCGVTGTSPPDRLLQPGPDGRIEGLQGSGEGHRRYSERRGPDAVEAFGQVQQRGPPARGHVGDDRPDGIEGGLDGDSRTRHQGAIAGRVEPGVLAQVDPPDHGSGPRGGAYLVADGGHARRA